VEGLGLGAGALGRDFLSLCVCVAGCFLSAWTFPCASTPALTLTTHPH
jgi:hypothetical protein